MNRFLVLVVVIWSALALRFTHDRWLAPDRTALPLKRPFSELPPDIAGPGWSCEDVPLDPDTLRVSGVSDYVQRRYRRPGQELWFYVGYVSGRVADAVHHPGICFPGPGMRLEHEAVVRIPHADTAQPLMFREYLWQDLVGGGVYTLSTFYYDGKFEPSAARLTAERALGVRYFAVFTVTCNVLRSVNETRRLCEIAIREGLPHVLRHLPDEATGVDGSEPGPDSG